MQEEYEEILKKVFNKFDVNKSGFLKRDQFEKFIRKLGTTTSTLTHLSHALSKDINAVFDYIDTDMDNKLNINEFGAWLGRADKYTLFVEKKSLLLKAHTLFFSYVDAPQKGLPYFKFEDMMENLNINHEEDAFDNLDDNNDGLISFFEFCMWLKWF